MNKIALALAVALSTVAGSAFAYDDAAPASLIENPATATIATTALPASARSGDAAPASVVVNAPAAVDYSSSAAIGANEPLLVSPRVLGGSN
ncbi:hypothetical protein EET67_00135 [Pseudaminobacter arsenicus]|uniref:DUF4148 domain-containing protein n=1 Tax=Borborobacter arsenicus TaxID=1851146 RepID=A0A432VB57_9HYPH|nr:hypothetical protein [Pseudaminobacter arsenicus]RUM99364.1 hypothetical protein EET67_00135 [Pseudaminobacter arsenicus]